MVKEIKNNQLVTNSILKLKFNKENLSKQCMLIKYLKIYAKSKNIVLNLFFSGKSDESIARELPIFIQLYKNCLKGGFFYLPVSKKLNNNSLFEFDVYKLSINILKKDLSKIKIQEFILNFGKIKSLGEIDQGLLEFPSDWIGWGNFGDYSESSNQKSLNKDKFTKSIYDNWNNNSGIRHSTSILAEILNKEYENLWVVYWSNHRNFPSTSFYLDTPSNIIETSPDFDLTQLIIILSNMEFISKKLANNKNYILNNINMKILSYLKKKTVKQYKCFMSNLNEMVHLSEKIKFPK